MFIFVACGPRGVNILQKKCVMSAHYFLVILNSPTPRRATKVSASKEFEIDGRYNCRGPPYHIIIHTLQTVLHLNKKYLSDVQLPRIQ